MKTTIGKIVSKLIVVISIVALFTGLFPMSAYADSTATIRTPEENQYLELRAVSVTSVAGQNKQVIMELWGHNLTFKGFSVRFSFDDTKIEPSSFSTNEISYNSDDYFRFESEFADSLDFFAPGYSGEGAGIEAIVSMDAPVTTGAHVKHQEGVGDYVETGEEVLIGKMSFQMSERLYDADWFQLEESNNASPQTGIKIVVAVNSYYEAQSTFRFTNETASSDADLSNIVVSHGVVDNVDPSQSTYKEYALTPTFDKDTRRYDIELLDNIDDIDLKVVQSDANSTLKVSVPKRDGDGNLIYEDDLVTIKYEEKDITSGTPLNIILNELGLPDTVIKVKVLAEDTVTDKEYTVVISRPYGTISGKIFTEPTKNTTGTYNAEILAYSCNDTAGVIDWDAAIDNTQMTRKDDLNAQVKALTAKHKLDTNDDGTFEIKVIPGQYDILIDKPGYLDRYFVNITVNDGDTINLVDINKNDLASNETSLTNIDTCITLFAGDCNKNGIVEILDSTLMVKLFDKMSGDEDFDVNCDLNDSGKVEILDKTALVSNNDKCRKIIKLI